MLPTRRKVDVFEEAASCIDVGDFSNSQSLETGLPDAILPPAFMLF